MDVGTVLLIGLLLGYVALTMIIALVGPESDGSSLAWWRLSR